MSTLLTARGLRHRYTAARDAPVREVLNGVDVDIASSGALAIVGPSGSGKSTLLHILGGLLPPSEGTVEFEGKPLHELAEDDRARLRNRRFGFVFQSHHLLPQCTALENAVLPVLAQNDGPARVAAIERAKDLLERVGLADQMGQRPAQLSGGEAQRAALVRALVNRPAVLFADEPTGSLDSRSAATLADLLLQLRAEESVALVVVTHAPRLAARMDRILTLEEGRLLPFMP